MEEIMEVPIGNLTIDEKFYYACSQGNVKDAQYLLCNYPRIQTNWRNKKRDGTTPFYGACFYGHIEVLLLDQYLTFRDNLSTNTKINCSIS